MLIRQSVVFLSFLFTRTSADYHPVCGRSYKDAARHCKSHPRCNNGDGCPDDVYGSPMTCYAIPDNSCADMAVFKFSADSSTPGTPPSATPAVTTAGTPPSGPAVAPGGTESSGKRNMCGDSYTHAKESCSIECEPDHSCPNNFNCYSGVECELVFEEKHDRVCGVDYADAEMNCDTNILCPSGFSADCPGGQNCYTGINCYQGPATTPDPLFVLNHDPDTAGQTLPYVCGSTYDDAASTCSTLCPSGLSEECPPNLYCFVDVPCKPKAKVQHDFYCGVDYVDAVQNCAKRTPCPHGTGCPDGEQCFAGIDCEDTEGPMTTPAATTSATVASSEDYTTEKPVTTTPESTTTFMTSTSSTTSTTHIATTSTTFITTTETPDISTTNTPDASTTEAPDASTTETPDASATETPDASTTETPDASTTEAAEYVNTIVGTNYCGPPPSIPGALATTLSTCGAATACTDKPCQEGQVCYGNIFCENEILASSASDSEVSSTTTSTTTTTTTTTPTTVTTTTTSSTEPVPITVKSSFCGRKFTDAVATCSNFTHCDSSDDCGENLGCFADITCEYIEYDHDIPSYCGKWYADAAATCSSDTMCETTADCPQEQACFHMPACMSMESSAFGDGVMNGVNFDAEADGDHSNLRPGDWTSYRGIGNSATSPIYQINRIRWFIAIVTSITGAMLY